MTSPHHQTPQFLHPMQGPSRLTWQVSNLTRICLPMALEVRLKPFLPQDAAHRGSVAPEDPNHHE